MGELRNRRSEGQGVRAPRRATSTRKPRIGLQRRCNADLRELRFEERGRDAGTLIQPRRLWISWIGGESAHRGTVDPYKERKI